MALKPDCGLALSFCEALGVEQTDVKRVCDESERLAEESCRQSPLGLPDVDIGRNFMIELLALCSFNFRPLKHLSVYTTSKVGGSDQSLLLCHFLSQLCVFFVTEALSHGICGVSRASIGGRSSQAVPGCICFAEKASMWKLSVWKSCMTVVLAVHVVDWSPEIV